MAQIMNQKRGRGSATVGEASGSNAQSSSSNQLSRLPTPGTLTDELAALFECPVCFEIVLPPIMQCQVGHLVCSSCRPKLSCCPTCRGTLGKSIFFPQNLFLKIFILLEWNRNWQTFILLSWQILIKKIFDSRVGGFDLYVEGESSNGLAPILVGGRILLLNLNHKVAILASASS